MATLARKVASAMRFTVEFYVCDPEYVYPAVWEFSSNQGEQALELASKLAYSGNHLTKEYSDNGLGVLVNVIAWPGHPQNEDVTGVIIKQISTREQ